MRWDNYLRRHPVIANLLIIIIVGFIGIFIVYLSLSLFTRHGEYEIVPEVEQMSYTQAIKNLHEKGLRTDIRDSIYNEEIEPGFVVEQFPKPGSKVKPGRKIFLYINAVHPREVIIDSDNSGQENALNGYSLRQGMAKLEELGFKKVNVVKIPGESDRIIRLLRGGRTIAKMEKVPVNQMITIEVYDGQLRNEADSLLNEEFLQYTTEVEDEDGYSEFEEDYPTKEDPILNEEPQ